MAKYYISGGMTGYEDFNRARFVQVQSALEDMGHEVFNPALRDEPDWTWGEYLWRDVRLILTDDSLDGVVHFDNWLASRGAVLESLAAHMRPLPRYLFQDGEPLIRIATRPVWVPTETVVGALT